MHKSRRLRITDLNPNIICQLCSGYLIDATTIIECLHSFCRSCIVKYLESNKYCPICDVQVHKTKPLLNIRSDQTLQDIVYKLVPGLFQNEMCRRRDFYVRHPDQRPPGAEESGEVTQFSHIYTADESISLSLEYYNNNETNDASEQDKAHPSRRYLRCPAAVSIQHLQKLIRAKYGLSTQHRVDILYMTDTLREDLTLMDVAYIYLWRRKVPLHLTYRIFEVAKRIKTEGPTIKDESKTETWKEVQLTISENGVMSVTNIQDAKKAETLEAGKVEVKLEDKETIKDDIKKENGSKTGDKRKLEDSEPEPIAKISKMTSQLKNIQQLSRNHPLKIHSQSIKNHKVCDDGSGSSTTKTESTSVTRSTSTVSTSKLSVPVMTSESVQKLPNTGEKSNSITPSSNDTPKTLPVTSSFPITSQSAPKYTRAEGFSGGTTTTTSAITTMSTTQSNSSKTETTTQRPPVTIPNSIQYSRVSIVPKKSPVKPPPPMSYKTLRDPPKPWNPQIPRQNLLKPTQSTSTDTKTEPKPQNKPAKFFKMRNNMPRYLGNPASGVKPMYQVREGNISPPDKKLGEVKKEIKKPMILKIDPKTLKPITEKTEKEKTAEKIIGGEKVEKTGGEKSGVVDKAEKPDGPGEKGGETSRVGESSTGGDKSGVVDNKSTLGEKSGGGDKSETLKKPGEGDRLALEEKSGEKSSKEDKSVTGDRSRVEEKSSGGDKPVVGDISVVGAKEKSIVGDKTVSGGKTDRSGIPDRSGVGDKPVGERSGMGDRSGVGDKTIGERSGVGEKSVLGEKSTVTDRPLLLADKSIVGDRSSSLGVGERLPIPEKLLIPERSILPKPLTSELPEMKINQSTVPILNPLRTQKSQTSPKILDRRSPKNYPDAKSPPRSPLERGSPKPKLPNSQSKSLNSPTSKKDKLNLNYTPPNPFIPNPPNLAPFYFSNYPSYDPRLMSHPLHHNLPLGLSMYYSSQQKLGFGGLTPQNLPLPTLIPSLGLEWGKSSRSPKPSTASSPSHDIDKRQAAKREPPRQSFNGENNDNKNNNNNNKLKAAPETETKPEDDKIKVDDVKETDKIETVDDNKA